MNINNERCVDPEKYFGDQFDSMVSDKDIGEYISCAYGHMHVIEPEHEPDMDPDECASRRMEMDSAFAEMMPILREDTRRESMVRLFCGFESKRMAGKIESNFDVLCHEWKKILRDEYVKRWLKVATGEFKREQ